MDGFGDEQVKRAGEKNHIFRFTHSFSEPKPLNQNAIA
jgi:hypothetical protein